MLAGPGIHADVGSHIGRIVTGCLVGGLVVAVALVIGPVAERRNT